MAFTILSETSKQYLMEEDAVKGFRAAVENGQSRLALQILTDIIDAFNEVFVEAFDADEAEETAEAGQSVPAMDHVAPSISEEAQSEQIQETKNNDESNAVKQKSSVKKENKVTE